MELTNGRITLRKERWQTFRVSICEMFKVIKNVNIQTENKRDYKTKRSQVKMYLKNKENGTIQGGNNEFGRHN